jgi:hypothetical protein
MIHRLQKQKYNGFLAIEYVWTEWQQCNRTDNLSETIILRRQLEALLESELERAAIPEEEPYV